MLIAAYFGSDIDNGLTTHTLRSITWHFRLMHNLIVPINCCHYQQFLSLFRSLLRCSLSLGRSLAVALFLAACASELLVQWFAHKSHARVLLYKILVFRFRLSLSLSLCNLNNLIVRGILLFPFSLTIVHLRLLSLYLSHTHTHTVRHQQRTIDHTLLELFTEHNHVALCFHLYRYFCRNFVLANFLV